MTTDTTERGLERLICTAMTGYPCDPAVGTAGEVRERPAAYGAGWIRGRPEDHDREYCVDLAQLAAFLIATQRETTGALDLGVDGPTRRKFLARLQGQVSKLGTIDVLRHGIKHGPRAPAHHRVHKLITEDIPGRVAADEAYRNARRNPDRQNARIEHDQALERVMTAVLRDDTELLKQFAENESSRRWLTDTVFGLTCGGPPAA